jgi:hypothetical protein
MKGVIVDSRLIIIRIVDDDGNINTIGSSYSRHIEQEKRDFNKSLSSFFSLFLSFSYNLFLKIYKGGQEKLTFLEVSTYRLSSLFVQ